LLSTRCKSATIPFAWISFFVSFESTDTPAGVMLILLSPTPFYPCCRCEPHKCGHRYSLSLPISFHRHIHAHGTQLSLSVEQRRAAGGEVPWGQAVCMAWLDSPRGDPGRAPPRGAATNSTKEKQWDFFLFLIFSTLFFFNNFLFFFLSIF
jgi:hypothetical protein